MVGRLLARLVARLSSVRFGKSPDTSTTSIVRLSARVAPEEEISSFVTDRRHARGSSIHHSRLMPRRNPHTKRLETSVCRSSSLDEAALWSICSQHFDAHSRTAAIGRGVGPASAVYAESLSFDADGVPYAEHANVVGWDEHAGKPDHEFKNSWMNKAQRIAKAFKFSARTTTPALSGAAGRS